MRALHRFSPGEAVLMTGSERADRRSMDPPLRERLSWRNSIDESAPASRAAMARTGAVFGAAAGLFAFVSVAIPDTAVNDEALLAATGVASLVIATLLLIAYDQL